MPIVPPAPANPAQMPTALARPSGEGGAHAHGGPGGDEGAAAGGDGGHRAGCGEDADAGEQREAPAEPVAEGPERQQQRGEDDGVGVDDPLLAGLADREVLGDEGEGVVQAGDAGHDHGDGQAHGGQGGGAPARAQGWCLGGGVRYGKHRFTI